MCLLVFFLGCRSHRDRPQFFGTMSGSLELDFAALGEAVGKTLVNDGCLATMEENHNIFVQDRKKTSQWLKM